MRHREFVPTAIAPQTVHGVEHVQQGQITVKVQSIPSGRAHIVERNIGFRPVDVLHSIICAHKTAHQSLLRALALQVFDQRQQGALTSVERDHIDKVKQTRFLQLSQLGVGVAATQSNGDVRRMRFDGLGNPQRGIHGTWKGYRQQHQRGLVLFQRLQGALCQQVVEQCGGRCQGLRQGLEAGLAAGQGFAVAHELKAGIHRIPHHIGHIVQIQGGQMPCTVLLAQCTKGPAQGVSTVVIENFQGCKAWSFGQEAAPANAVTQRGVASL